MAHFTWTLVGGAGRNHRVGLYHGNRTGHVMIYCDSKIMQIDFHVLESKTYSFFIDDEFCELKLERKGDTFYYTFEINREVDTPRNRQRKVLDRKHWRQTLTFFGVGLLAMVLIAIAIQYFKVRPNERAFQELMAGNMADSSVAIIVEPPDSVFGEVTFSYIVNSREYTGDFKVERPGELFFPLRVGDEFDLAYHRNHPDVHTVDLAFPTINQIQRYKDRAEAVYLKEHPDAYPPHASCMIDLIYSMHGLDGLATVFHQSTAPAQHPYFNVNAYRRMVRDPDFEKRYREDCWEQSSLE